MPVPKVAVPSLKVTVPVGAPEPEVAGLTAAVNVTDCAGRSRLALEKAGGRGATAPVLRCRLSMAPNRVPPVPLEFCHQLMLTLLTPIHPKVAVTVAYCPLAPRSSRSAAAGWPRRAVAGDHGAAGLAVGVEIQGVEVESPATALGDVMHAAPVGRHEHIGRPIPGQGVLLVPSIISALPALVPVEVKAKPLSTSGSASVELDTARFSKLITVTAVLADPTVCVKTAEVLPVKLVSAAIDGRDRVAADRQAAGGEGGLIDSVHHAERAGAQSRGAVHEGHGAGGRAGAGSHRADRGGERDRLAKTVRVETRRDAGGRGSLRDCLRQRRGSAGREAAVAAIDGRDRMAAGRQVPAVKVA